MRPPDVHSLPNQEKPRPASGLPNYLAASRARSSLLRSGLGVAALWDAACDGTDLVRPCAHGAQTRSGFVTYRILFKLVLQYIPPEAAHALASRTLWTLGRLPGFRTLLRRLRGPKNHALEVRAFGLTFPSPLGVAAGMDKNLTWFEELGALGFGFVEVGTVTAIAQPGNPRPRVHRVNAEHALINSMGFPNKGALAARKRLLKRSGKTLIAVNVGPSRAAADATADYRESVRQLAPLADMLVLNVSSPNTPGVRDLQAPGTLRTLVREIRAECEALGTTVPLLVKISPDLADYEVDAMGRTAVELELDGIVAVNTTTSREALISGGAVSDFPGALSGPPLKGRALEVLRRLRTSTEGKLILVSVGGIGTAADALERIRAGATLVQAHTGFVYGGPMWPSRINRDLAEHLSETGASTIQALVGAEDPSEDNREVRLAGGSRVATATRVASR